MTRRDWLAAAAAAPAILRGDTRPNILFLLTDQQTRKALSCAGNPWVKTPNMDSIARSGVRFAQAYCPYPVCSPSRGAIVTGRMPHETGVRDNAKAIRPGMPTMGEIFRAAGYQTVYGGKWHLPKSFDGMTAFEKLIGGSGQGADMDAPLADASAAWLRSSKPKQPFLMVASFMNPHDICEWIRKHPGPRAQVVPADFPAAPRNLELDPLEPEAIQMHRNRGYDLMSQAVGIASHWAENEFRHYLHDYYRLVESVDREIGKVLDALREKGLDRNTWIIFTSDHGEGMGGHRWVQKASFYEESVGVPLILSGPGLKARVESRALVNLTDILPTMCEIAGVKPPEAMRGQSLLHLGNQTAVSELRYGSPDWEGRMLVSDRFKYVVFNNGARPEQLFDRKRDPGESTNLVAKNKSAVREHRQALRGWIAKTGDDFRF